MHPELVSQLRNRARHHHPSYRSGLCDRKPPPSDASKLKFSRSRMRISTLLLDTSALNPGRIRYPKSRRESHPLLWGPRVNTCEVSGLTVSQRDRQLAFEAISELFIMDKLTAARCQNTMTIIDQRLLRGPLTVEAFKDKGSGLELFIQGHSVHELLDSHYVLYKPPGVSGFEQSTLERPCFRSFLPYASMPFGYISPIERSSSGLLILLNDIRIRNHLERGSMPRRYSVRVAGNNPVQPVMIAKINQAFWLRKLTVTPRE